MVTQIDVIAFGAHPDDVEAGAGGLVARLVREGYGVGIVDLTAGEMASNGTAQERAREAQRASEVLGVAWRKCLRLPDRGITLDQDHSIKVVEVLRRYRPSLVLCPYWEDRHPDHVQAARLVQQAHFDAGLHKLETATPPYRPPLMWHYFMARAGVPQFIVDVSAHYEVKREALLSHQTQFGRELNHQETFLNAGPGSMLSIVESRDRYFGTQAGCFYGEGFITAGPLIIQDLQSLLGVRA